MFLGEMLMGMDLEGEEPGDDSKCMVVVVVVVDVSVVCECCVGV